MEIPTWEEIRQSRVLKNTPLATGYFSRCNQYQKLGYYPVPICGKSPEWFYEGFSYKKLAPKYYFFIKWKNGEISNDEYIAHFYEDVLSQFSVPKKVLRDLKELTKEKKIVLLCYEKPFDFCHRHVVSHWISNSLDMEIGEVKI